jgi:hypothetical protein
MIEERFGKAMEAGGKLRVKSALNPILWLCLIISVPGTAFAVQSETQPIWLIILIFIPVSLAAIGFLFLLIFDRDKLQSEEYQIKKQSLEIYQKGLSSPVPALYNEIMENPEISQSGSKRGIEG